MERPATLFEKLWRPHVLEEHAGGRSLLFVDRHLLCDGSFHAFNILRRKGLRVAMPALTLATADHYVPTLPGRACCDCSPTTSHRSACRPSAWTTRGRGSPT